MNNFLINAFVSTLLGSGAFWLLYRLFFYNRPQHRAARIALIGGLVLPLILPLAQVWQSIAPSAMTISYTLPEQLVGGPAPLKAESLQPGLLIAICYASVTFGLLLIAYAGWLRLTRTLATAKQIEHHGLLVFAESGIGPGTVGKRIFFPDSDLDDAILAHETGHVRLGHRYDLLLANLLCYIGWINPFFWMLRRELRLVHEFEADAFAASRGVDAEPYARLLLRQSFRLDGPAFGHLFFHHPIKQRITMLFKKESNRPLGLARLVSAGFAAALISASLLFVQCRQETPGPESAEVFKHVDQMPSFKGDLNEYLASNLRYPDAARKAGNQGRCVIEFVVTTAGKVDRAKVVRSSGFGSLDAEALRVINSLPAWNPGSLNGQIVNVQFAIPVTFALDEPDVKATSFRDAESIRRIPGADGTFECIDESQQAIANRMPGEFSFVDDKGKVVTEPFSMTAD